MWAGNENFIIAYIENDNLWKIENAIIDLERIADFGQLQQLLSNIRVLQEVAHQLGNNLNNQYQGILVGLA